MQEPEERHPEERHAAERGENRGHDPAPSAPPERTPVQQLGAAIGGVAGFAVGWYAGMNLLIPVAAGVVALFVLKAAAPRRTEAMQPAAAVLVGHLTWIAIGVLIVRPPGGLGLVTIEIALMAIGAVWLIVAPSWAAVAAIATLEVVGIGVNLLALSSLAFGTLMHKAIVTHLGLRVLTIVLMVAAMRKLSDADAAADLPIAV